MAKCSDLFKGLFEKCRNGAIPNLKFQGALRASHAAEPIYFHNQPIDEWCTDASASVRQVARFFRMLKESLEQQEATLKKALGMKLL